MTFQIKLITAYKAGLHISQKKLNEGFTDCFTITFTSEKNRDAYLIDPA
ncbi:MAG: Dabb family protein [Ferruginibacter sp.]|nr:Dabb family protein [Ferruginibacter sp.]